MGICRLLEESGFTAAFPLHDGHFDLPQVIFIFYCSLESLTKVHFMSKKISSRMVQLLQCSTDVKYSTSTGPAGVAGSSTCPYFQLELELLGVLEGTSRWTTSESTLVRGSRSTLRGLDSTLGGCCLQPSLAWPSSFTVPSLL